MGWEHHKDLFAWDGSLIDIYVLDTTLEDWQRLLDFLRASPYDLRYSGHSDAAPLPDRAETIFAQNWEAHVALSIDESQLSLKCHFFTPDEIEFDLNPHAIDGQPRLDRLLDFMRALGSTLGKAVILTPENFQQRPLYRFDPRTDIQEWPTYGD